MQSRYALLDGAGSFRTTALALRSAIAAPYTPAISEFEPIRTPDGHKRSHTGLAGDVAQISFVPKERWVRPAG